MLDQPRYIGIGWWHGDYQAGMVPTMEKQRGCGKPKLCLCSKSAILPYANLRDQGIKKGVGSPLASQF